MTEPPLTRAERRAATAQRILDAAQAEFGDRGLEATTIRAIARRAGIDPSLVIQHYASKADLFAIAARLDEESTDDDVGAHLADVVAIRLGELPPATRALMRSMLTAPAATNAMREFLQERVANLAGAAEDDDAELRAALVVCSIFGVTVARHFIGIDALDGISGRQIEEVIQPWLTDLLRPPS